MANEALRNIQLGVFVVTSTVLLVVALYLVGNNQNLFGPTFRVRAYFHSVNGLTEGNNVRFAGIDVGTVEHIEIENDSSVRVEMLLEDRVMPFIRKNSIASVGTDGLMGNKLVNINSAPGPSAGIADGDVLRVNKPFDTDEILHTLYRTNENVSAITDNIRTMTDRFRARNTLWSLLMDTTMADNVKEAVVQIRRTGSHTAVITGDLRKVVDNLKPGKGTVGSLLSDTVLSEKIRQALVNIELVSDTMALVSGDLKYILEKARNPNGAVGTLLADTAFARDLERSMHNISRGTEQFSENMEALQHSWLLRNYFRKKAERSKN